MSSRSIVYKVKTGVSAPPSGGGGGGTYVPPQIIIINETPVANITKEIIETIKKPSGRILYITDNPNLCVLSGFDLITKHFANYSICFPENIFEEETVYFLGGSFNTRGLTPIYVWTIYQNNLVIYNISKPSFSLNLIRGHYKAVLQIYDNYGLITNDTRQFNIISKSEQNKSLDIKFRAPANVPLITSIISKIKELLNAISKPEINTGLGDISINPIIIKVAIIALSLYIIFGRNE
jgi:hypothetical protein